MCLYLSSNSVILSFTPLYKVYAFDQFVCVHATHVTALYKVLCHVYMHIDQHVIDGTYTRINYIHMVLLCLLLGWLLHKQKLKGFSLTSYDVVNHILY